MSKNVRWKPDLLGEKIAALIESASRALADSGEVESAWVLRGAIDALSGYNPDEEADGGLYAVSYMRGYMAARRHRNGQGV